MVRINNHFNLQTNGTRIGFLSFNNCGQKVTLNHTLGAEY